MPTYTMHSRYLSQVHTPFARFLPARAAGTGVRRWGTGMMEYRSSGMLGWSGISVSPHRLGVAVIIDPGPKRPATRRLSQGGFSTRA
jgi:hypothetical protein